MSQKKTTISSTSLPPSLPPSFDSFEGKIVFWRLSFVFVALAQMSVHPSVFGAEQSLFPVYGRRGCVECSSRPLGVHVGFFNCRFFRYFPGFSHTIVRALPYISCAHLIHTGEPALVPAHRFSPRCLSPTFSFDVW